MCTTVDGVGVMVTIFLFLVVTLVADALMRK